jgi:hypothetical protein
LPALVGLPLQAQSDTVSRIDRDRFTVVAHPRDAVLARSLLADAARRDSFPGLPRPRARVTVAIAPDRAGFRRLTGGLAPEWGAAVAFPASQRIVLQGQRAGSDAGDPIAVFRHELAHLALHEFLGDLPPRWFDEGYASYAAGEWGRDELLATNVALALGPIPSLAGLDSGFYAGPSAAAASYALAYRAVAELAALDTERGLSLFFGYWRDTESFEQAVRRAYGLTGVAFEDRWQSRTRRRYGALAAATDVTLASAVFLALLLPLWLLRRRRDRRRLARLVAADAEAERRARESILEELLRSSPGGVSGTPPSTDPVA